MNIKGFVPKSTKGKVWAGVGLFVLASMIASPFLPAEAQTAAAASKVSVKAPGTKAATTMTSCKSGGGSWSIATQTCYAKGTDQAEEVAAAAAPKYGVEDATAEKFTLGGDTELTVTFPIQNSLTAGMIRQGAAIDAFKIIDAVRSKSFDTLRIVGTYDGLQDRYGNDMGATEVMWAVFDKSQVRAINTDGLRVTQLSDLESVSCTFGMSPAMGYKLQSTSTGDCY